MNILPPRNEDIVFFLGDIGRVDWPIREPDQSWMTWLNNPSTGSAVQAIENQDTAVCGHGLFQAMQLEAK